MADRPSATGVLVVRPDKYTGVTRRQAYLVVAFIEQLRAGDSPRSRVGRNPVRTICAFFVRDPCVSPAAIVRTRCGIDGQPYDSPRRCVTCPSFVRGSCGTRAAAPRRVGRCVARAFIVRDSRGDHAPTARAPPFYTPSRPAAENAQLVERRRPLRRSSSVGGATRVLRLGRCDRRLSGRRGDDTPDCVRARACSSSKRPDHV